MKHFIKQLYVAFIYLPLVMLRLHYKLWILDIKWAHLQYQNRRLTRKLEIFTRKYS